MPELGDSLDLPYETNPPGQPGLLGDQADILISGGVVTAGCTVPVGDEVKPAILFRFATPTGEFHAPVLLVLDERQMAGLTQLVNAAVSSSIEAAGRANRKGRNA